MHHQRQCQQLDVVPLCDRRKFHEAAIHRYVVVVADTIAGTVSFSNKIRIANKDEMPSSAINYHIRLLLLLLKVMQNKVVRKCKLLTET